MTTHENISVESGYVRIERGAGFTVDLAGATGYVNQLAMLCNEAGVRNILIVGPQTNVELSTMDIMELGSLIADARLKVAMVEEHDAPAGDVAFLENVAWNRGGLIRFFRDEESALDWLGVSPYSGL